MPRLVVDVVGGSTPSAVEAVAEPGDVISSAAATVPGEPTAPELVATLGDGPVATEDVSPLGDVTAPGIDTLPDGAIPIVDATAPGVDTFSDATIAPPFVSLEDASESLSIPAVLATGYTVWKVAFIAAALGAIARSSGGLTGCLAGVRLTVFTNIEFIRCSVASVADRVVGVVSPPPVQPYSSGRTALNTRMLRSRRDGMAVIGIPPEVARTFRRLADASNYRELMIQIGRLLVFVYGAFLAVWFWATRVRWNGRT